MYHEYYGFDSDPFRLTPDTRALYLHGTYKKSLNYLRYAVQRGEGIVVITGSPGSGKTTLVEQFVSEHDGYSTVFTTIDANTLQGNDLITVYTRELEGNREPRAEADTLSYLTEVLGNLHDQRKSVVLILDEAQTLSKASLDKIHLLSNLQVDGDPLVQIFLVGHPSLRKQILSAGLEQLHQRIIASCNIEPLNKVETQGYVMHKLLSVNWDQSPSIDERVFNAIHSASQGVPRWINQICSRMLVHGVAADKSHISLQDICEVLNDLLSEDLLPRKVRLANKRLN